MKIGRKTTTTIIGEEGENSVDSIEYVVAEELAEGYEDVTSVPNFIDLGERMQKDYKWIRRRLQEFDFSSLSENDQFLVAKYKATSDDNCKAALGDSYNYWITDWDLKS